MISAAAGSGSFDVRARFRCSRISPGDDQVFQLVLNVQNLTFERPGDYVVVFRVDGTDAAKSPFKVKDVATVAR